MNDLHSLGVADPGLARMSVGAWSWAVPRARSPSSVEERRGDIARADEHLGIEAVLGGSSAFVSHPSTWHVDKDGPLPCCLERPPGGAVASVLTDLVVPMSKWETRGGSYCCRREKLGPRCCLCVGMDLYSHFPWSAGLRMGCAHRSSWPGSLHRGARKINTGQEAGEGGWGDINHDQIS